LNLGPSSEVGTGRIACATERQRIALLLGAVPGNGLSFLRFDTILAGVSLAALLLAPASIAQQKQEKEQEKPASEQTFAALAQKLNPQLEARSVKRLVILDFEDPNGKVTPFGVWLAEQLAMAPGNPWAPIEVVDRKQIAERWEQLRVAEPHTIEPDRRRHLARAFDATLIEASYGAAENGIGVTLRAATSRGTVTVAGKIAMTDEMKSHLAVPLESLVPSDGIFEPDRGGVGLPSCEYCPNPQFTDDAVKYRVEGTVTLSVVINTEGRATQIAVFNKLGRGLDEKAVDAVRSWRLKPAVNIDGRPVPTRTSVEVVFRLFEKK